MGVCPLPLPTILSVMSDGNIMGDVMKWISLIIAIGTLIWGAAFLAADIDNNRQWNERQDQKHEQFMRRDVANEQFKAIRNQLDRIEKKLENQ